MKTLGFQIIEKKGKSIVLDAYNANPTKMIMKMKTLDDEEKIDYHNDGFVRWSGVFGQLEYKNDAL